MEEVSILSENLKIVTPSVKHIVGNDIHKIAKCTRVCYASTGEESLDESYVNAIVKKGHLSILRHATHYYVVPKDILSCIKDLRELINNNVLIGYEEKCINNSLYSPIYCGISANEQVYREHIELFNKILEYEVSEDDIPIKFYSIKRFTFELITQISTTRELNRKSPNNILEQSTRYVEIGTICLPHWLENNNGNITINKDYIKERKIKNDGDIIQKYITSCITDFNNYSRLLELGVKKEDARGILPLDTMTKVVYTYTLKEWKDILQLRLYGKFGKPHPNCIIVMTQLKELLEKILKEETGEYYKMLLNK